MKRTASAIDQLLRSLGTLILVTITAALLAVPRHAMAQRTAPTTITAAVIGVTVSIWPAIVAKDKSFFEDEGLRVDLVTSGASARSLQQVGAGVAHVGSSSMVDTVRAIDAGADVKIFINSLAVGTTALVAAKSVKTIRDLKGKRVMTGGQRDITNLWWIAAAKHNGLDPARMLKLFSRVQRGINVRVVRRRRRGDHSVNASELQGY